MLNLTNTWMADPIFLAQSAHFFSAVAVVMTAFYFFGKKGGLLSASIFTAAALVKEFWFDLNFEIPKQSLGDSSIDFAFYMVGIVLATCILLFTKNDQST